MRSSLAVAAVLLGAAFAHADEAFEKEVRPLLVRHCLDCHGPKKARGGLRLDTRVGWQKGGDG